MKRLTRHRWREIALALSGAIILANSTQAQTRSATEKIVISYPSRSLSAFFLLQVAWQKGFFKEEGLDANPIYVRGGIDLKAIISGDVDYALAAGTAVTAFVAGAPVRMAMGTVSGVEHVVLSQPKYRALTELKGQVIGSLNPGGLVDVLLKEILSKNGINPGKDVTLINIGGTPERYAALRSGSVAATILSMPFSLRAEKEGYRKVAAASDYLRVPANTLVLRADRLTKHPQQVKRTIRALLKALIFVRQNRHEMVQMVAREFAMDLETAGKGFDQFLRIVSRDGSIPYDGVQFLIDVARKAQKVEHEIPASQVIDSSLLQEVLRESQGLRQ